MVHANDKKEKNPRAREKEKRLGRRQEERRETFKQGFIRVGKCHLCMQNIFFLFLTAKHVSKIYRFLNLIPAFTLNPPGSPPSTQIFPFPCLSFLRITPSSYQKMIFIAHPVPSGHWTCYAEMDEDELLVESSVVKLH